MRYTFFEKWREYRVQPLSRKNSGQGRLSSKRWQFPYLALYVGIFLTAVLIVGVVVLVLESDMTMSKSYFFILVFLAAILVSNIITRFLVIILRYYYGRF